MSATGFQRMRAAAGKAKPSEAELETMKAIKRQERFFRDRAKARARAQEAARNGVVEPPQDEAVEPVLPEDDEPEG